MITLEQEQLIVTFLDDFNSFVHNKKIKPKLVAVSKKKEFEHILAAKSKGISIFGESYPQELRDKNFLKQQSEPLDFEWHFIGNVQKNKIKYIVGTASLIHSVSSIGIAQDIEDYCKKIGHSNQDVLFQVNVSNDSNKLGFTEKELFKAIKLFESSDFIQPKGLMTILDFTLNDHQKRSCYQKLYKLGKELSFLDFPEISMGMSQDYQIAIDEGATLIRVGTSIFGPR
jgi:pyridoxal phosphate enzyme (YggS family)